MLFRCVCWFFCTLVAIVAARSITHDSTSGYDSEVTVHHLRIDNLDSSTAESVEETRPGRAVDLGALLDHGYGSMVALVAGDTRLVAHRAVLAARSPVFQRVLQDIAVGEVAVPDVEGPVLRQLVAFLYTLQAPQLPAMAPQLLAAAHQYGLPALKADCERQVAARLSVETAAAAAVVAVRHSSDSLRKAAVAYIRAHIFQVMATQGWADAIHSQPRAMTEVARLLSESPAETSSSAPAGSGSSPYHATQPHSEYGAHQTPTTGATTVVAQTISQPDDDHISRLRSLSEEEKGERLIEAAKQGDVGELEALLAAGADVEAWEESFWGTALHWAAEKGHEEAARRLLAAGAPVDDRDGAQEATPLHWAAGGGQSAVVRLLLAAGADHGARDENGRTPLHWAAVLGHTDAAAALLAAGADRAARDDRGNTPLDEARSSNQQQVVELLLQGSTPASAASRTTPTSEPQSVHISRGQSPASAESPTTSDSSFSSGSTNICLLCSSAPAESVPSPYHATQPHSDYSGHQTPTAAATSVIAQTITHPDDDHISPLRSSAPAGSGTSPYHATQPHSDYGVHQTLTTAATTVVAQTITQPDDDHISRLRSLSAEEKNRRLIAAAEKGAVGELEALLAAGADVKARDGGMWTALHWAARKGHEEAARRLLAAGAAVGARDSTWHVTPLHWAADNGHAAVVRLLLAAGADHTNRDEDERTPLHRAAVWGNTEAAAALLAAGADRAASDKWGETPLDLARKRNWEQVVEQLLQGSSAASAASRTTPTTEPQSVHSSHGQTPASAASLTTSVSSGSTNICLLCSSAPAGSGSSPYHATQPHSDYGVHQTSTTAAPLVVAQTITHPDDDHISRLRSLSAQEKGERLIEAAKQGAVGELEALLAAGADLAARDKFFGGTALHWAAEKGHEEAARRLLAAGAAVDARDTWLQRTPLHEAAVNGHAAVVRLLLAAGADHGARNENERTPLHYAAESGDTEAAAALLAAGADRATRDKWEDTPLDLARSKNQQQVVELLLQGR